VVTALKESHSLIKVSVFTFKQAYEEKYWAMTGGGISFILLLILVVLGEASKGVAAYYLIVLLIYCTCAYIQYNDDKVIILDEGSMTYCLTVNKRRIVGNYHNIYIRLVLERSNVLAKKHDHVPAYRLVLSGVKIDPTQLTRKPTDDIKGLRRLGQKLAKNLNINYFDEANGTFIIAQLAILSNQVQKCLLIIWCVTYL